MIFLPLFEEVDVKTMKKARGNLMITVEKTKNDIIS